MKRLDILAAVCMAVAAQAQSVVETVHVVSRNPERQVVLPGEIFPYLRADLYAKVSGFVETVDVDRGSRVERGRLLATLSAPELAAQLAEAQSKVTAAASLQAEAEARLAAAQSTYDRMKAASETPGAVAGNDLVQADRSFQAAQAAVHSIAEQVKAAKSAAASIQDLQRYLEVKAPFDGMITERDVHPGALVGPGSGNATRLLRIEQISRLRLTVAVPEAVVGGLVNGAHVPFVVSAYPGETFSGMISRIAHTMDVKTRTMAVEIDVDNPGLRLSPGMYAEVRWPFRRKSPSFFVPPSSIVTTTERSFVIRLRDGVAEWVDVTRGAIVGDLAEVFGALKEGDLIVRRGSDELREGTRIKTGAAAR